MVSEKSAEKPKSVEFATRGTSREEWYFSVAADGAGPDVDVAPREKPSVLFDGIGLQASSLVLVERTNDEGERRMAGASQETGTHSGSRGCRFEKEFARSALLAYRALYKRSARATVAGYLAAFETGDLRREST